MVDIHCHILPGIDDGPRSWDLTADMCRVAALDGITHIVATPHCNDEFAYDRDRYTEMTFSLGCDFHFSYDNIQDALAHPRRYTIGESQYLLVEFSDFGIPPEVKRNLLFISSNGMVPIITHPERNQPLLNKPEMVLQFVEQGCLVQVTANSLTGYWGSRSRNMAEWLLKRRAIHVIASDAHDPARRRPVLSEARKVVTELAGAEVADALFVQNPAAVVDGERLPNPAGAGELDSEA
jgi:protein-tyrosine phosphatase